MNPTYRVDDPSTLLSPSLLIFPEILRRNAQTMIEMAGGAERLRPHVKTHKMPEVVRALEEMGIHKHKCATIAEAEMVAQAGGKDVLLAYPLVGPNIARMVALVDRYPETTFRALVDDRDAAQALSDAMVGSTRGPFSVLIDLELGMGRTGIAPERAFDLALALTAMPGLHLDGLHAYDGHIHDPDPEQRLRAARPGIDASLALRERLRARGIKADCLVLGGTPTFPIHAALREPGVECSPGTCLLHDHGYGSRFADLPFTPAAVLFTRVISRPRPDRVCLDLGYKAVASDPKGDRVRLLDLPDAKIVGQNEEHLVVETPESDRLPPGTALLAIPTHICPTCALHAFAYVIEDGRVTDRWAVAARDRVLQV